MNSNETYSAGCSMASSLKAISYIIFALTMLTIILASRFLHFGLRHLRQPRVVSEFFVGLTLGNSGIFTSVLDKETEDTLRMFAKVTSTAYMFVTGLEMDIRSLLRRPGRDAIVAYAGTAAGAVVFLALHRSLLHREFISLSRLEVGVGPVIVALLLSSTSSSVLTRLTTLLKIGKSDIGRLTVGAGIHSDMISTLLLCVLSAAAKREAGFLETPNDDPTSVWILLRLVLAFLEVAVQGCLVFKVAPPLLNWVNERNPEGKRIKGLDLTLSLVFIGGLCAIFSRLFYFGIAPTAFLVGLFLPREGRISSTLIRNFNFYLTTVGLPLYFCSAGMDTDLRVWINGASNAAQNPSSSSWTWASSVAMFTALLLITTGGKVLGSLFAALGYGFRLPEAVAVGLLLNVKGYLHIFCAVVARENNVITEHAALVMLVLVMSSIVFIPLVVAAIVWQARRRARSRQMALQWHDPAAELRMVIGLHGPHNVPAMINIVEATKGNSQAPLAIYAMDLVELTERADAALVHDHGGLDAVVISDEGIREASSAITQAFEAYAEDSGGDGGDGVVTVKRFLTVSMFANMHIDICNIAQDTFAVLILLPFHRRQRVDGSMDSGHPGFLHVNEKVMKHAPCTVGILVDRGFRGTHTSSSSLAVRQVAVVFVGGKDDREALCYAGRMAQHAGVHVTAIRFLHDADGDDEFSIDEGREMRLDDECFAQFYDKHVASGGVRYEEKYAANGAETVAALRALEPLYDLFLVGRGGKCKQALTTGMSEWAECPELGPIGDILASSDVSVAASVLVIQQHSAKGPLPAAALDADFSPQEIDRIL